MTVPAAASQARVRVLVVLPGADADGGAEVSFAAMASGLRRRGIAVHLAVLDRRRGLAGALERDGVVLHDLSSCRGVLGRVRALRQVIRHVQPDLVHAALFDATVAAQLAVTGTGVPVLVTWANVNYGPGRRAEPGTRRWRVAGYQALELLLGRWSCASYHAVTAAVARENAAALRVPYARVLVGERGRDPERYPRRNDPPDGSGSPRVVLAVGRQDHQKGYEDLLVAFDQVASRCADLRLRIAGREGSATPAVRERLGGLRHADRVELLGQRDDVPSLMAQADLVVSASWREGAAGALLEAMAVGTPIVATRIPGLDDVLVDGVTASVAERADLAGAIERALADPGRMAELAAAARSTFEQRFTLGAATDRMAWIYRAVVGSGSDGRRAIRGDR